jgi:hypothetical protein
MSHREIGLFCPLGKLKNDGSQEIIHKFYLNQLIIPLKHINIYISISYCHIIQDCIERPLKATADG